MTTKIGRYEVSGELGRGGMAVVYRGVDPVIQRPAALKVVRKADLPADEAALVLERFKREAQAAGSLHHPNIVAIYEYGEDDEQAWIAMELVQGRTLREHLIEGWRPEITRLPSVIADLLEALDYSHARGVVHRDVKPGNVLVSTMGEAKISDFGIARIDRSHLTQEGDLLGTPYYMAPEQFDGQPADERTDIYAAGVIVYEVLCGRRPFTGQGGNLMRQILDSPPPPASTFEPKLPVSIDMALSRALAKKPDNRYGSAREFLDALRAAFPGSGEAMPSSTQSVKLPGNVGALRKALGASAVAATPQIDRTAASTAPASPKPALKLPAALFVDDEERVVNALRSLFRDSFEVETATGGAQALELLRARRFHVLVSDQRMPEMPGVELLRQAKAIAPATVRILLTGYSDLAAIVGSVNDSEVFRFVSKPWNEEELRGTLVEAADVAIALEAAAARPAAALKVRGALLVLGDPAIARGARELARGAWKVLEAANQEDALALLAEEEIGTLVCDLDSASGDPAALLRVLKQHSPQTQLIATSGSTDAETIISLINEARIYRFLRKPLNLSLLHAAVAAALDRYARMAQAPGLLRAESAKRRGTGDAAERSLLGRIKALGGRFATMLGKT
ncbi:MAG: protein kinase domain-containing protein [Betaproteobacteria bacterium]